MLSPLLEVMEDSTRCCSIPHTGYLNNDPNIHLIVRLRTIIVTSENSGFRGLDRLTPGQVQW